MIESDAQQTGMEELFRTVHERYGPEFEQTARQVYQELIAKEFQDTQDTVVFNILTITKLRLQEDALRDFEAMNAEPFGLHCERD